MNKKPSERIREIRKEFKDNFETAYKLLSIYGTTDHNCCAIMKYLDEQFDLKGNGEQG